MEMVHQLFILCHHAVAADEQELQSVRFLDSTLGLPMFASTSQDGSQRVIAIVPPLHGLIGIAPAGRLSAATIGIGRAVAHRRMLRERFWGTTHKDPLSFVTTYPAVPLSASSQGTNHA